MVQNEDDSINGVMPTRRALAIAEEQGVDLVEIAQSQETPIVRIIDYNKFLYEQKKRKAANEQKQQKVQMKEIRFGPNTDDHDFNFKLKHAIKFLEEGNKVRAYVFFRGRSIIYSDRGKALLLKFADELLDHAKVEMMPKLDGKKMFLILAPKNFGKK